MVGYVAYSSNDSVVFENAVLDNCTLDYSADSGYGLHYWAYFHGVDPDNGTNEAEGLTVNDNCKLVG